MEDPNIVIKLNDVSKIFEIPHEKNETLKGRFLNPFRKIPKDEFKALNDINFSIKKGEFVGIIGKNGSGKSTLLKILAGIYAPSDGRVEVKGHLVPFLELGVGFNPDLTGRENIFLNGTILGMTRKYIKSKFDEIVDFAEINEFIDLQVKNYSSGMITRLAFSIAIQARAEVYLLDEILAVGDSQFQKKSLKKMLELMNSGATVILVSHSMDDIKKYCDRVIFLEKGTIEFDGNVEVGVEKYMLSWMNPDEQKRYFIDKERRLRRLTQDSSELKKEKPLVQEDGWKMDNGDGRAKITDVQIIGEDGNPTKRLAVGEKFTVIYKAEILDKIENPIAYVGFHKVVEQVLFEMNSSRQRKEMINELHKGDKLEVVFSTKNVLLPGRYYIWVHLGDPVIYGKGTGIFASHFMNFAEIEVYDPYPKAIPDWSGVIAHEFKYQVKISK